MSKTSDEFRTPPEIWEPLNNHFHFKYDACCTEENDLVGKYVDAQYDDWLAPCVLTRDIGPIFMNPPYSKPGPFMDRALENSRYNTVVCLVKADPSTKWFRDCFLGDDSTDILYQADYTLDEILKYPTYRGLKSRIIFLSKRIRFLDSEGLPCKSVANFPSAIIIFYRG